MRHCPPPMNPKLNRIGAPLGQLPQRIEPGLGEFKAGEGTAAMVGAWHGIEQLDLGGAELLEGGQGHFGIRDNNIPVSGAVIESHRCARFPPVKVVVLQCQA